MPSVVCSDRPEQEPVGAGAPIKAIARVMGCSKNTVKRALASDGPAHYQRPYAASVVDDVEPRIRELLAEFGE